MIFTARVQSRLQAKISAIGSTMRRTPRELLIQEARLAAISCAKSSQPYGAGATARNQGNNRVSADIWKVYTTPLKAFDDIRDTKLAKAFYGALRRGESDKAQAILDRYGRSLRGVQIMRFDGGSLHKANRDKNSGRVRLKRAAAIVTNTPQLRSYIALRQKNVGFGKSGWADIARQLGTTRGLKTAGDISATWITHNGGKGTIAWSGTDDSPIVTLTSQINYASEILPESDRRAAIRIARERLTKNLEFAIRAELRQLRAA